MKFDTKIEELRYAYLDYHDNVWSNTTYTAESSKTQTIVNAIQASGMSGTDLYTYLKDRDYGAYTIKALMQRAAAMYDFGRERGLVVSQINPFRDFLVRNAQVFRHAYKSERLTITFETAKERIESIEDDNMREFCLALLFSGLRIHEAYKVNHETSTVVGKGGKERYVMFNYRGNPPSEYAVRKALKEIGLKPHSLRKLLATRLARSHLTHTDIMTIMGWSNIETATKYFQPLNNEQLAAKLKEAIGE